MTTTITDTDDTNARLTAVEVRLAVVETEIRNINTRLEDFSARLDDTNANIRQLSDRIDRMQADTNARLDLLASRIERVFWGVIAVGLLIGAGLIGTMLTLIFRLT